MIIYQKIILHNNKHLNINIILIMFLPLDKNIEYVNMYNAHILYYIYIYMRMKN